MNRLTLPRAAVAAGLLWATIGTTIAQDTTPKTPPVPAGLSPQTQKINELIRKGWDDVGVKKPADKATDDEFMRRAFIDLIGRIPTPEEIRDYEADRSTMKRMKLVSRLVNDEKYVVKANGKPINNIPGIKMNQGSINYSAAYAENFADLWTTWLLTRSNTHPQYRAQLSDWLTGKFEARDSSWKLIANDLISATGRTASNNAVVFVLRHLGDPIAAEMGAKPNFSKDGKYDAVPITSRVTKLFLGIQSQCVQCHDHPFNKEYIQEDFWGVNAFFRQTDRSGNTNQPVRRNNMTGEVEAVQQLELTDKVEWNNGGMVLYERRDGQRKASFPVMLKDIEQAEKGEKSGKRLVSGNLPANLEGKTRRQILSHWVTEHDNFSKAYVNRMWGHLFGRGLNTDPTVADFSSNNAVVHPELLAYLGEEFAKYNYDTRKLLEWICTSEAYNLSHVANKAYVDQKYDPYFARMPLKAMSPEVMFDTLATATRAEGRKDKKAYEKLRNDWTAKLTQQFGDDEGNEINFNGTVVQALLMMNGKEINGEIKGAAKDSVVDDLVKRISRTSGGPRAIYDELFLMTLSRHATKEEKDKLEMVREGRVTLPGTNPPKTGTKPPPKVAGIPVAGAAPTDVAFYQDVFWALLNCSEFMLNH